MADTRNEDPNPDTTRLRGEGIQTMGRTAPGDAGGLSPGKPDAPDAHAPRAPEGPVVEKGAKRGPETGAVYPSTTQPQDPTKKAP